MDKKKCSKCRKLKSPSRFYSHPGTRDKLQSQCRLCMSKAANARNKRVRKEKKQAEA